MPVRLCCALPVPMRASRPVVTDEELAALNDDELVTLIQERTGQTYGTASEVLIIYRGVAHPRARVSTSSTAPHVQRPGAATFGWPFALAPVSGVLAPSEREAPPLGAPSGSAYLSRCGRGSHSWRR